MSVSLSYDQMLMITSTAAALPADAEAGFIAAVTARLRTGVLLNQEVRAAINAALSDSAGQSTTFGNVTLQPAVAKLGPALSFAAAAVALRPARAQFGPTTSLNAAATISNP